MRNVYETVTITGDAGADDPAIRDAVRRSINRELAMMQEGYIREGESFLEDLANAGRSLWYTLRGGVLTVFGASDAEACKYASAIFLAQLVELASRRAMIERKSAGLPAATRAFRETSRRRCGEWTLALMEQTLDDVCVSMDFSGEPGVLA